MFSNIYWKGKLPKNIPEGMKKEILKLKKSKNKLSCLEKAYLVVAKRYYGSYLEAFWRFWKLFISNIFTIWNMKGKSMLCTHQNFVLRVLLVKSGCFKDSDIKIKWTMVGYISPHQYLMVHVGNGKWIYIDMWGSSKGIKFGDYARRLHF